MEQYVLFEFFYLSLYYSCTSSLYLGWSYNQNVLIQVWCLILTSLLANIWVTCWMDYVFRIMVCISYCCSIGKINSPLFFHVVALFVILKNCKCHCFVRAKFAFYLFALTINCLARASAIMNLKSKGSSQFLSDILPQLLIDWSFSDLQLYLHDYNWPRIIYFYCSHY